MENNENKTFSYTYSAKWQDEVNKIRSKYIPKTEDKMEQIRRLDESVTRKGTCVSLIIGTVSTLLLGVGMSCTMVGESNMFIPGIIVGVIGIIGISLAYPIYTKVTKKERDKIAPEIIRLTDELLK